MVNKKSGIIRKKRTFYAQVSNTALRDETMSLKAKGLLAIIESYLTLDNFILYKDFLLSKSIDGETAFRGAWKELKEHGYLVQHKLKDEDTKQFYYEYEICDNPCIESQVKNNNPQVDNPQVENPPVAFPHMDNPLVENPASSFSTSVKPPLYNNNILNNTLYINIIQTNIDYDPVFVDSIDRAIVDNIVNIMNEVLCSNTEYIIINKSSIPVNVVKSVFLKVNLNHIQYTLSVLSRYDKKINNIKGFIITTLYNAVLTLDAYYSNMVNSDSM